MLLLRNGVRLSLCYYPSSRESRLISYIGMLLLASISGGCGQALVSLNLSRPVTDGSLRPAREATWPGHHHVVR